MNARGEVVDRPHNKQARQSFPTVAEIKAVVSHPALEESVFSRMQAPFVYLDERELGFHREAVRLATRCVRTWVFDEPELKKAKAKLGIRRGKEASAGPVVTSSVTLSQFFHEYLTLLAESCVLQKRIADLLSGCDSRGQCTYVHSVEDALSRPEREHMLEAALSLYLEVYEHEQKRFAYGSSLKDLINREMKHYPADWHQLLLTSTRGDFWSRFDADLLAYRQAPSDEGWQRLCALYYNGDETLLSQELARVVDLPEHLAQERSAQHATRRHFLAYARVKKGYARLGDLPGHRCLFSKDASRNILVIDRLLWVDNVLEKIIDNKMLLQHDMYLRLHLTRLALACADKLNRLAPSVDRTANHPTFSVLERPSFACVGSETKRREREEDLGHLAYWFGKEAWELGMPEAELLGRIVQVRAALRTAHQSAAHSSATPVVDDGWPGTAKVPGHIRKDPASASFVL